MPLTTINGVLCLPVDEFQYYCHFLGLEQAAMTEGPVYTSLRKAVEVNGMTPKHFSGKTGESVWAASYDAFSYATDAWVIQEAQKLIREAGGSGKLALAQIGEQDIEGEIWPGEPWTDENGKYHSHWPADLSLTGPATLGGKILLELIHRLSIEVAKDKHALGYAPQERPKLHTLQPETPAEE